MENQPDRKITRQDMKIGYHASHEQFSPGDLLTLTLRAEAAGFTAGLSSDHFYPWSERQGQSGFAWAWLGAALQATRLPFGVVCAPVQRYNPAIIAQACATLAGMFPGRFWIAVGSGQRLNEAITGDRWPPKAARNERLREAMEVMRVLWKGETVSHRGLVCVEEARLYCRPDKPPLMIGAAITPATARLMGKWADGLITVSAPPEKLKKIVDAFREGGGEGKPMYLKVQVSYAEQDEEALRGAWEQWRNNIFDSSVLSDLRSPSILDDAGRFVTREQMREHVRVSAVPEQHVEWLRADIALGFEQLYLHNVNRHQEAFIDTFGAKVLPELTAS